MRSILSSALAETGSGPQSVALTWAGGKGHVAAAHAGGAPGFRVREGVAGNEQARVCRADALQPPAQGGLLAHPEATGLSQMRSVWCHACRAGSSSW